MEKEKRPKLPPVLPWQQLPARIWIVRKGNGKVEAYPSPCVLRHDQNLEVKNWSDWVATVDFSDTPIVPGPGSRAGVPIPPGHSAMFHVPPGRRIAYYEYRINVSRGRFAQYVEGGSRPAIIIDP